MTSDFYVVTTEGDYVLQAKYSGDLDNKRTLEKLELERRYWQKKEVPWFIITEKDIPTNIKKNTEWLNPYMSYEMTNIVDKMYFYECQFIQNKNRTIIELSKELDKHYNLENGSSLAEIRALLATKFFKFDITKDLQKLTCGIISIAHKSDIESIEMEYLYAVGQ